MMQIVPLQPLAAQTLAITLNDQPCEITVLSKSSGMYLSLQVNNAPIISGVICQNNNPIVRDVYLGFVGDLAFFDLEDRSDPEYQGLGSRWVLVYIVPTV